MSAERPRPPSGLAPGTREHWIPWRMRLHGWTHDHASDEFAAYEKRMNSAAWDRYRAELVEWERKNKQDQPK